MRLAILASAAPRDGQGGLPIGPRRSAFPPAGTLDGAVRRAIFHARRWLLAQQQADGRWMGAVAGDSTAQSETILLLTFLGRERSALARRAARALVESQLPEGGWSRYPGGPADASDSVLAYFALKLSGEDPAGQPLQSARRAIMAMGGAAATDNLARSYLALLGQIPYCIVSPMQKIFSREPALAAAGAVIDLLRPVRRLEARQGIRELFVTPPERWPTAHRGLRVARGIAARAIRTLPALDRRRQQATEARFFASLGAAPKLGDLRTTLWRLAALAALGQTDADAETASCRAALEELIAGGRHTRSARVQPLRAPARDTAIALRSLATAELPPRDPAACRAAAWLRSVESASAEELSRLLLALVQPYTAPERHRATGGEPAAALRLVTDQTLASLDDARQHVDTLDRAAGAMDECLAQLVALQNRDGGWSPQSDVASSPDVTGRALEALTLLGQAVSPAARRAEAYLRRCQASDGSWFCRAGRIFATWQALAGLVAAGANADDPAVAAAVNWLVTCQNSDGGWGETPQGDDLAPALVTQTAWALLGLMAAGEADHAAVVRGVRFLLARQDADGNWPATEFTALSPAADRFLCFEYDTAAFPLMALARWAMSASASLAEAALAEPRADDEALWPRLAVAG